MEVFTKNQEARIRQIIREELAAIGVSDSSYEASELQAKNRYEVGTEEAIADLLRSVGMPAHTKGYRYVTQAINMVLNDISYLDGITKRLYPDIAELYSTTPRRVERAIRQAVEAAWDRGSYEEIEKCFGYTIDSRRGKATNSEFIATIAQKLLLSRKRSQ